MKTQAIILALTAAGFAQQTSNVLINTEPNFQKGGFERDLVVPFDQCVELPQEYWLALSAIAPNSILKCDLFSNPGCGGVTQSGGPIEGRVPDLRTRDFDNRAFSIKCTRK